LKRIMHPLIYWAVTTYTSVSKQRRRDAKIIARDVTLGGETDTNKASYTSTGE
jgi:hypothetical protein